jgi:hypothetical protein
MTLRKVPDTYLLVGILSHASEEVEAARVVHKGELVLGCEQRHVLLTLFARPPENMQ